MSEEEFSEEEIEILDAICDLEDKLQMALGEDAMTCDTCKSTGDECDCDEGPCPDCHAMHHAEPIPIVSSEPDGAVGVTTMLELLDSLAWLPHSAYHIANVKRILAVLCPAFDFSIALREYERICLAPPQPGSPKLPMPRGSSHMAPMIEADFASLEARALAAGMLRRFRETPITIEKPKRGIPNVFPMEVMEEVGRFTPLEEPGALEVTDSDAVFDNGTPFKLVNHHMGVIVARTRRRYPGHPAGSVCKYWRADGKSHMLFENGDCAELPDYSPRQLAEEILHLEKYPNVCTGITPVKDGQDMGVSVRRYPSFEECADAAVKDMSSIEPTLGFRVIVDPCQHVSTKDDKEHE